MRSALLSPRPGDIVETASGITRWVRESSGSPIYVKYLSDYKMTHGFCTLETWRRWCRVQKAVDRTPQATCEPGAEKP